MNKLKAGDLMTLEAYSKARPEYRQRVIAHKKDRTIALGDHITLLFEDEITVRYQVQEMLRIEKIFEEDGIRDELNAYNPLIPQGAELIATFMVEIADETRRRDTLGKLGGIEHSSFITVGGETIKGTSEEDAERTTDDGKASSVQFVHFRFNPAQIAAFRAEGAQVVLGFNHANYGHMTVLPATVRAELAGDFDQAGD